MVGVTKLITERPDIKTVELTAADTVRADRELAHNIHKRND